MEITVGQKSLCQRAERNDADAMGSRIILQSVLLNISYKHGIFSLVDNKRCPQLLEQFCCRNGLLLIVVGNSHIQCLTGSDNAIQCTNGLLQRCIWIRSVMVEDIHIIQSHTLQALIQAGHQVLFTAPVAVRSGPHIITSLRGNHQFIPVHTQILFQDTSEIFFCSTVYRSIVVRQIKMCDTVVKSGVTHVQHIVKIPIGSEIVP